MLGPPVGRYVVRDRADESPQQIVVLQTLGAPQRRLLGRRRARPVEPQPEPTTVATTRASVIDALRLSDETTAASWLRGLDLEVEAGAALSTLNRVMHAHRIATADPRVYELSRADAMVVRAGHGTGEHVADGRWTAAIEAPPVRPSRVRRSAALQPTERLAALLGRRDVALACEEFALRARLDLDAGRLANGVLGVRLALDAALVELAPMGATATMAARLQELHDLRDDVVAAAHAVLVEPPTVEQQQTVERALRRTEAALRARTVLALGAAHR